MRSVKDEHGSVSELVKRAGSRNQLRSTLTTLKGIGPTTADIFLGELADGAVGSATQS